MRLLAILLTILAGLGAGLGLTALAVGPSAPVLTRSLQGWTFSPRIGSPEIDPYSRARLFVSGGLPLASGEGYALIATEDSAGTPLDTRCHYRITSPFPVARYWTITLTDPAGRLIPNLAGRSGFTSSEIVRPLEGRFALEIGPEPQPGNWLPTGSKPGTFEITLRFYETPLAATATRLDSRALPTLTKIGCAA